MRNFLRFFLSLGLLAGTATFVHAQTAAYAEIARIDAANFPRVSALVDVYDANGEFISGVTPGDITVFEDGQELKAVSVTESNPPVQVVVAVNPGPAMAIRDTNAEVRYDRVVQVLSQWSQTQPPDSRDDLSLVSLSGSLINHANVNDWAVSLNSFKPDLRNTTPNLQTLAIALDTANAPTPEPGMKRAVLFITPHMDDPNIDNTIAPLIQRAVDSKIRVFVWFIDAEDMTITASANAFKQLAQQTNGAFFAFSGNEAFPDPAQYFAPLRHLYEVTYESVLVTSGSHTLGLYIRTPQATIPAVNVGFTVDVQPPNPIFVSPPLQITRQAPEDDPYNPEILSPDEQIVQIIIEFPDGHQRGLKRTSLYVDGQVVAENLEAPFDTFAWDLSAYEASSQHQITVEAEDVLGLKKSSISIPVTITVVHPPKGPQAFVGRYSTYLTLGAIVFAGFALLFILLRSRVRNVPETRRQKARKANEDPLTQPVPALPETGVSGGKNVISKPLAPRWMMGPSQSRAILAPAYLMRLMRSGEPANVTPISLIEADLTFGTDPVQSRVVLDDPTVAPLHTRIKRSGDGEFTIHDNGSVAGTWVNYEPVTREGVRLRHGDRVQIGGLIYRFELHQPPAESEPKVFPVK